MPLDETLVDRVRTALGTGRRIEEKRMFGGTAFMVEGKLCVSVGKARIMCRIDPAIHDAALKRDGCTTVVMKGRAYRGYVHIADDALKTRRELGYWVRLALDFNGCTRKSATKPLRPSRDNARRAKP
jgi:TfoX/Sxy family transcriptional regulator of competence genes